MKIPFLLQLTLLLFTVVQASDYSKKSDFSAKTEHASAYSGDFEDYCDKDDTTSYGSDIFNSEEETVQLEEEKSEDVVHYWDKNRGRYLPYPFATASCLVHITTLDLGNRGLSEVPQLPPNLIKLLLDSNAIARVREDFAWPIGLEILNLSWNKFEKVPRKLPDSLRMLLLKSNRIKKFPAVLPKSLELLDLEANEIESVSGAVGVPDGLHTIRLQRNGVSKKRYIFLLEDTVNAKRSAEQPKLKIEID